MRIGLRQSGEKRVRNGDMVGNLMHRSVAEATGSVQSEMLITPLLHTGGAGCRCSRISANLAHAFAS